MGSHRVSFNRRQKINISQLSRRSPLISSSPFSHFKKALKSQQPTLIERIQKEKRGEEREGGGSYFIQS
jgi:hypothetical protein